MRYTLLGLLVGCAGPVEAPPSPEGFTDAQLTQLAGMRLDITSRPDPTNRYADHPVAARLGQALFFDGGLSPAGISCATCHAPDKHFADGRALAQGVGVATRHTPTIVGSQWGQWFFWDGRADSLWSQALGPIENPVEMGSDRVHVVRHVLGRYPELYEATFGPPPALEGLPARGRPAPGDPELHAAWMALDPATRDSVDSVFANIGKAIAAYERALVPQDAPFDRYVDALVAGDPGGGGHLDASQVRGLQLFVGKADCVSCHNGPMLTDRAFHNLGVPEVKGYDQGRTRGAMLVQASAFNCDGPHSDADDCPELRYLNPTFPDFQSAFKTPTLRYVLQTAPYMHHGGLATIADVLEFYSELENPPPSGHRELTLKPLHLTPAERAALVAFLASLTGGPLPEHLVGAPRAAPTAGASYEGD